MSESKDVTLGLLRQRPRSFKWRLTRRGLIAYEPRTATTIRLDPNETQEFLGRPVSFERLDDFAEIVHLEVSAQCQLACPYCYVHPKGGEELSTENWKRIISDLAGYGVLQVTFGGGEPTLRPDLKELALHVRRSGLNLCMTTNGMGLTAIGPDTLCLFNQVNVSYHHAAPRETLSEALSHLRGHRIPAGVNFLAIGEYVPELPRIADMA
ncbi:MAG: radical SAM protein, partial [Planctomycetes bacterium]|nr:radical SAM protein [Planctomycetota bacterium]